MPKRDLGRTRPLGLSLGKYGANHTGIMSNSEQPPILITGAGRRIGAHLARRLLESGQPILAHYRSETEEIKALQADGADTIAAEFADAGGVQSFALAVHQRYPRLRGIIHNASAFSPTSDESTQAAQQFQNFFNVHMLTPYLLNRALENCLRDPDGASTKTDIIHITDIYADNPAPEYDVYCATKAGLQNLALSSAKRLAPEVKVNVIQPGPIMFAKWHDDAQKEATLKQSLLQKMGGPEAIYQAVRGILDNGFMTGAIITVDGGSRWKS